MKHNKSQAARSAHETKTSSNEPDEQKNNAAKVTTPFNEDYSDHIDHCQEELQQVGLLASESVEQKGNSHLTTRLSSFVPNILVRSHNSKTSDSYRVSSETRNASTATRAMKKMTRNGESNNPALSGDGIDLESNEKATQKRSRPIICCILSFMAICIGAILILFLVLTPRVLDKENNCLNGNKAFQNYNLFSTKTLYTTAISYLGSLTPNTASSTRDADTFISDSVIKPDMFASGQTLKDLTNRLTSHEGCKLRQYHFYGRHAARGPDSDSIKELNIKIKGLLSRIAVGRHNAAAALQLPVGQAVPESPNVHVSKLDNSNTTCYDPIDELVNWANFMDPKGGNLITEFGYSESEALAKRLKDIYPDIFNGSITSITLAITNEIRTAQTAMSFLTQMANPPDVGCAPNAFPTPINLDPERARRITEDKCFNKFIESHKMEDLQFHKECHAHAKKRSELSSNLGVTNSSVYKAIADNLAEALMGHNHGTFQPDDAKAIYDMCRYETALFGKPSIWCRFFKEKDLVFMEYVSDVEDYEKEAYGLNDYARSTCFLTRHLIKSTNSYASNRNQKPEAHFHFTHSSVIQKLIAATIDLRDENYIDTAVISAMKTGDVPPKRLWRTSLQTPFSANIAFTLFDCDKTANTSTSGEGVTREIDLKSIKVVASLNEQPIKMDGCNEYACDYLSFKSSTFFRNADPLGCDLSKVCPKCTKVV